MYEDAAPEGFDLTIGGRVKLPSYTVYENPQALPRAFVVHYAEPLPQRATVLEGLKNTDFRQKVLLEGFEGNEVVSWWGGAGEDGGWRMADRGWRIEDGEELIPSSIFHPPSSLQTTTSPPAAVIRQYLPNRVVIGVDGAMPGYLVLTDVWYPGWTCTVDGQTAPVLRADFLFRGVHVPAGEHEVVFTFAPESYRRGKMISLIGLGLVAGISAWSLCAGHLSICNRYGANKQYRMLRCATDWRQLFSTPATITALALTQSILFRHKRPSPYG